MVINEDDLYRLLRQELRVGSTKTDVLIQHLRNLGKMTTQERANTFFRMFASGNAYIHIENQKQLDYICDALRNLYPNHDFNSDKDNTNFYGGNPYYHLICRNYTNAKYVKAFNEQDMQTPQYLKLYQIVDKKIYTYDEVRDAVGDPMPKIEEFVKQKRFLYITKESEQRAVISYLRREYPQIAIPSNVEQYNSYFPNLVIAKNDTTQQYQLIGVHDILDFDLCGIPREIDFTPYEDIKSELMLPVEAVHLDVLEELYHKNCFIHVYGQKDVDMLNQAIRDYFPNVTISKTMETYHATSPYITIREDKHGKYIDGTNDVIDIRRCNGDKIYKLEDLTEKAVENETDFYIF